jgi:hypothetical protein
VVEIFGCRFFSGTPCVRTCSRPVRHHSLDWHWQLHQRPSSAQQSTPLHVVERGGRVLSCGAAIMVPLSVEVFEASLIVIRAAAAVLMVALLGLLMGFGFPTGIALVNALDTRPTPWF